MSELEEKKERAKKVTSVMLEIVDENGVALPIKPEQVKILTVYTKITEEIFDIAMNHPNKVIVKI
jgi:hypothetical protein